ncbi:hypothetical protein CIPAW_13G135700 [Carya illinoinensis]|uniref:Uncharacterized protein n=1 Tax=Carya illinoinensis TaxID=32201 RepID=A0A8T1NTC2_CARIL|nr:hypothetical protein CIPAW_13G135700 [Carya illinoinensis]
MAEGILFNIAQRIIESLGSQTLKEASLFCGVTDELHKLESTVSTIQAVLLDAEEQQVVNHEVRHWLEKLKDIVYDMMTRDKMAKKVRIFFSKSNQLVYDLKMGHEIKAIRQKLDAISSDRKFHLEERNVEIGVKSMKRDDSHSFVLEAEVIGRKDDKKKIIDILLSDSELKMWVCVSDIFDVQKIVEQILESITNKKQEVSAMETLASRIRKEIEGKKYLLVLDDVWNEDSEKWDKLKTILMGGARGNRILVTTRSEMVANITGIVEHPYFLGGLNEEDSWSLFKQMAFRDGEEAGNSTLVTIGKEILKKCLGVPLAIRTIGRTLSYLQNSETEWLLFKNNKLSKIKEKDILPTLKLSYDQLPSHLKQCFAYCSLFPKDYMINKPLLVNLWIAQGFVKLSDEDECLEDVGHEYFMDLYWRSFFQEARMDGLGNIIYFKMHDLMHDLAVSVARSLITIVDNDKKIIIEKTRHVSIVDDKYFSSGVSTSFSKATRIRTFLTPYKLQHISESACDKLFSSCEKLRALDLHGTWVGHDRKSIKNLKLLRYLDLSGNSNIKKLPNSITKLQNLHTLVLFDCVSLEELPRELEKLINLRHLVIDNCEVLSHMPCGLGKLTNLQTLSSFVIHSVASTSKHIGGLGELNQLNNLRGTLKVIGMRGEKDVALDYKAANLKEKHLLQALYLQWRKEDKGDEMLALESFQLHPNLKKLYIEYYACVRFPISLSLLTNLVTFELWRCKKLEYLPRLSQLPSLQRLYLKELDSLQYISNWGDQSSDFLSSSSSSSAITPFLPSLDEIQLLRCHNLKGCITDALMKTIEHPSLPLFLLHLSKLDISSCPMLTSLPMFPNLEMLELSKASWKPVQQTMMMTNVAALQNLSGTTTTLPSSSSTLVTFSCTPLSKLKHLHLEDIEDLETLSEEGFQNLTSLQYLFIKNCPRLKFLSQGIKYLTALQELELHSCFELCDLGDWEGLKNLLFLTFSDLPMLVFLPSGLQHVTTLQDLKISNCVNLMDIPEWIGNWTSLVKLTISGCYSLKSLPEVMHRLTSLKILKFANCPNVLPSCERETG